MGQMGKFNLAGLEQLQKDLDSLQKNADAFVESCAKELAARLLREVISRTPVGDYSGGIYACKARKGPGFTHQSWKKKGMQGGTLRRGWTAQSGGSGSEGLHTRGAAGFVDTLKVYRFGDTCVVNIINQVSYASYVEYGHRTADHKGWVKGHFMMTVSIQEIQASAPHELEQKLKKFLSGVLK